MALLTFPLVDNTYFIRNLNIPNVDTSKSATNAPSKSALDEHIAKYEPICLELIFGYPMYKVITTEDSTTDRMKFIMDGGEYTDQCGNLQKWKGLRNVTSKTCLTANYIYFMWQENNAKLTTGKGTVVNKSDGGRIESPASKMMNAWNDFSEEVQVLIFCLWNNKLVSGSRMFPEFDAGSYKNAYYKTRKINFYGL